MNFFQHQDRAKKNSFKLVALFVLGVLALIVSLTLVVLFVILFAVDNSSAHQMYSGDYNILLHPDIIKILLSIAAVVLAIVLLGSLTRSMQLRSGGKAVAAALGGRLIHPNTQDGDERKVLNVVEEMAIASGMAVPPVFMIEDEAINAFAAGYDQKDAVIGVTRGCIKLLNREELQGVIAHEFSHILHGDMRLNIKLVSWLYGIILIGQIGSIVLRSQRYRRFGSNRRNEGSALLFIGLAMMIAGYAGSFFGGLIKSAVSRQREYLADASAVRYTRNPQGIAGALKKIGANAYGSRLQSGAASEFSHMFFSDGVKAGFTALMATHPPLEDRIKRVEPRWNGKYPKIQTPSTASTSGNFTQNLKNGSIGVGVAMGSTIQKAQALDALGNSANLKEEHIQEAKSIKERIDDKLLDLIHEPFFVRSVIYAVLLSRDETIRTQQLQLIDPKLTTQKEFDFIVQNIDAIDVDLILPVVEISLATLKELSDSQYKSFKQTLIALIKADNKISFLEWSIYNIVTKNIEGAKVVDDNKKLASMVEEGVILLSMLAYAGQKEEDVAAAFKKSFAILEVAQIKEVLPKERINFKSLDSALQKLVELKPMQKLKLLRAMIECVSYNEVIDQTEAQLLRAIADSLGVALPPIR